MITPYRIHIHMQSEFKHADPVRVVYVYSKAVGNKLVEVEETVSHKTLEEAIRWIDINLDTKAFRDR